MAQHFRIFISSPSDVFAERERVERVIKRLNGEFGADLLEAIRWERSYYTAAKTFQDQIPLPSETDLVLCILWKRLGFELPPDYRRTDGTTPTGTEYEFEDAMKAAHSKGTPDVLVYRKTAPVLLNVEQVETERAQFEALKTFWARWFRTETGHFTAAYQSFDNTDQFEQQVEDHIRQWLARHKVSSAGVTWPIDQRGSPFRGLEPFDADHADMFFGRRRVIERARERLADAAVRGAPFLLILGTSGSGKSSLARAGLLPRLTQAGAVAGVDVWRRCVLRPSEGDSPLHALARALFRPEALPELADGDSPAPPDLATLLAGSPNAAARAISRALGRATASIAKREGFDRRVEARLLLLVDQFEETLAPSVRDPFAQALASLVGSGVVWVVATLRSDLYAPFQASPILTGLRDAGAQLDLLPPSAAELTEIVTGPAAAAGLRFDQRADGAGLDETLTGAADQPGALPLLQLTLDALFEARDLDANLLTFASYDALGGLPGVIERRAEATLAAADADAAATLPSVLRALVSVSDDGLVISRTAMLPHAALTPAAHRLVDAFVAARLLVADTQGAATRIRVAHDALLSGWPRAADAIAADREMLRTRGRVEAAARRWVGEARDADFLLPSGRPLAEAAELAPDSLDAGSAAFVAASLDADRARRETADALAQRELRLEAEAQQARADAATRVVRRTRVAAALVSVLLIAAAGAAFYANAQKHEAERQTAEAQRQTERAERSFQAALAGGASLIAAADAHLADGGMTRRVARELLTSADGSLGQLLPKTGAAALSPPLLDIDSRLQASFSRVFAAVCEGGEARLRAERAVAAAGSALQQAPTEDRAMALMIAQEALGLAIETENDWPGAGAALAKADAMASGHDGPAWKSAAQKIRRELAYTVLGTKAQARGEALLRDDLAWQQSLAATHPDDPAILAAEAYDERQLAYAARFEGKAAEAGAMMDRETALLHRLASADPANVAWQHYLGLNAQNKAIILDQAGDRPRAVAKAREASDLATKVLAHDPANAIWLVGSLSADVRLAITLMHNADPAGAKSVLRADMQTVKTLTAPGANSIVCQVEAAAVQSAIGNAMTILGSGEDAIPALEAGLSIAQSMAAAAPTDRKRQHAVVDAQLTLAQSAYLAHKPDMAIAHARSGIVALQPLLAAEPGNAEGQHELAQLRLLLDQEQQKAQ